VRLETVITFSAEFSAGYPVNEEEGRMKRYPKSQVEIRDVAAGLWIWRLEHPHWKPGQGWEPVHTHAAYERALKLTPWSG